MDRQAWIAVTLCVIAFFALQVYNAKHLPPPAPPAAVSPAPVAVPGDQPTATAGQAPPASAAPAASPVASVPPFAEKSETLRNDDVELFLTNRGGGIREARLLRHVEAKGKSEIVLNSPESLPIGAIVEQPAAPALPEFTMARQPDGSVQMERAIPQGLSIRKRFFFPPTKETKDNYASEMQIDFRNDGPQPYSAPGYFIALGSTRPTHPNDIPAYTRLVWSVNGESKGVDVGWFEGSGGFLGFGQHAARPSYQEKVAADWAAMSNQFFTTILTPLNAKVGEVWGKRIEVKRGDAPGVAGIEGAMALPGFELQPGQTNTLRVQLYTGPKLYRRLAALQHDEAEIMNFSAFSLLKLVSQALLNFMNLLHSWVGDYGFAIILLTACVKGVLWPLQNKANRSMRRMSLLAPKMQELKEKHKDDPTRMNQEVMKLYKEHGVNPVGGCLPMLIQIPVFFGLFNMLGQVAELRNASFLWVKDLSQPDTIAEIPGLGWDINILPILMGATNVWLMQMTPKTGDAMQRRVLMFMPLIFLIFCYNFAAALALYYTTQNLFTILQLWHNQKQPMPVLEKVAPAGKKSRKGRS
ncbi:MAG TPA: membrane protein insertase YidC [Chthoniobacterales bacterium]|nr:membrane protein insertase YidC [Chthoniobacterales bacterium]